jgi:hypothetical protein
VLPPDGTDTIKCGLQEVMLDDNLSYMALSYTWDPDNEIKEIECNGMPLRVGRNLWTFLHQFRRRDTNNQGLLWIDAICINQASIGERNHQVAQMRDIYAGAASVIVWLGGDIDDATLQMAFDLVVGPKRLQAGNGQDLRRHRSQKQWKALRTLLDTPRYWSRVWIIQEFILAKSVDIWSGERSARLEHFEQLCRHIQRFEKPSTPHAASSDVLDSRAWTLSKHRSQWLRGGNIDTARSTFRLGKLLQTYTASQSSDIRDKVYALLGIACDTSRADNPIVADYAKSPLEVLTDVIRNQCRWKSLSDHSANYKLINLLCGLLEVSSAALTFHVMRHAPDLQSLINILTTKDYVHAPLRSLGTIIDTNGNDAFKGDTLQQGELYWPSRYSGYTAAFPKLYCVSAKLMERPEDVETGAITKLDLSAVHAEEFFPPQSYAGRARFPLALSDSDCYTDSDLVTFGDGLWHHEVQNYPEIRSTTDSERHTVRESRRNTPRSKLNIFVGTENLIGITSSCVRPGDVVCVADEDAFLGSAFIMRRSFDRWNWLAIGVAIIPHKTNAHEVQPTTKTQPSTVDTLDSEELLYDQSVRQSLPSGTAYSRDWEEQQTDELVFTSDAPLNRRRGFTIFQEKECATWTWKVRPQEGSRFVPRPHVPGKGRWLRLFCPPTCLPELARRSLLSRAFVPKFSRFTVVRREDDRGAMGSGYDKDEGKSGREEDEGVDARPATYQMTSAPKQRSLHEAPSAAVGMGSIPLPSFERREPEASSTSRLRIPDPRPRSPIANPRRPPDDD